MKKYLALFLIILACTSMAACGAASAPPIDLPAPVVGRVTTSAPDSTGKSTVTGTEGAVTPNTTVLAINDRLDDTTTATLWKLTDALMPLTHAQEIPFPDICSFLGHACTTSAADGSFSLQIDSVVGDNIILVLIDASGVERSPRVTVIVPTSTLIASCAGASTTGSLVDIVNVSGTPVTLFQSDGVNDVSNVLMIGTEKFALPGCYAKRLAAQTDTATGDVVLATASVDDRIIWLSYFSGGYLVFANTITLDTMPYAITFDDDPSELLVATHNGSTFEVRRISIFDGSTVASMIIPSPASTGTAITGILSLNAIGPFAGDLGWLGAVVQYGFNGSYMEYFTSVFNAKTLTNLSSGADQYFDSALFGGFIPEDVLDAKIVGDLNTTNRPVVMLVADHGNSLLQLLRLKIDMSTSVELDVSSVGSLSNIYFESMGTSDQIMATNAPRRMALGQMGASPVAYVLTDQPSLWRILNYPLTLSSTQVEDNLTGIASDPIGLGLDDVTQTLFAGDTSLLNYVDLTAYWGF